MRINESPEPMLRLVGGGERGSKPALSPFGPQRVASTTTPRTQHQALSESLNCLDSKIENLESRYLEVCATLNLVMADLVRLGLFGSSISITEEDSVG